MPVASLRHYRHDTLRIGCLKRPFRAHSKKSPEGSLIPAPAKNTAGYLQGTYTSRDFSNDTSSVSVTPHIGSMGKAFRESAMFFG